LKNAVFWDVENASIATSDTSRVSIDWERLWKLAMNFLPKIVLTIPEFSWSRLDHPLQASIRVAGAEICKARSVLLVK
jgi:hypothetical protein